MRCTISIKENKFNCSFTSLCLGLMLCLQLNAQDDSIPERSNYWRFLVSGGLINQTSQTIVSQANVNSAFSPDGIFSVALYSDQPRAGWMVDVTSTSKNCRYFITSTDTKNDYGITNASDRYYQLGIKKTYRINLNQYFQGMIAFGPHVIFNSFQGDYKAEMNAGAAGVEKINTSGIGAGFDLSVYLLQRFYRSTQFLLCLHYQRGFFGLYDIDVYQPNQGTPATYRFNGTGAGLRLGVLF